MSFSDTWATAPVDDQPDRAQPPEPGLYTVAITAAKALTSEAGEDWVIIEMRGVDGASTDHEWSSVHGFRTPQAAGFTKRVCRDLGVDIDSISGSDISDLDHALRPIVGTYHTVQVKNGKGDYKDRRNTYFQGPVKQDTQLPPPPVTGTNAAANGNDDDIPFLWDGPREYANRYHANR